MIGRKTRAQEWTEMMALNPATPPPPAESHIAVGDLLQILNNAVALKEHIAKINAAHAKNKKDFEASRLRIEAEHKDHLAELTRENAEALAKDRKQFAADRDSFAKDRAAAWAEIEAARKAVAADRESVDAMKADLSRRLQRVREVATESA
jgi:predicted  nucleic acid-binding Zn-ribbon protein